MGDEIPSDPAAKEVRSTCGALLARVVDGTLEFKCRRSRSVVRIPIEELLRASHEAENRVIWVGPSQDSADESKSDN